MIKIPSSIIGDGIFFIITFDTNHIPTWQILKYQSIIKIKVNKELITKDL